jgi:acetolactate decarboxylase
MLMRGNYEGCRSVGTIRGEGNFGIGTFNALDGELIALDGVVYKAQVTGEVSVPADAELVPFVSLCSFSPSSILEIEGAKEIKALEAVIQQQIDDDNAVYAVKITGDFDSILLRSVVRQEKPYKPLVDVVREQSVYGKAAISGTLVGYLSPSMLGKVTVAGLHVHFLSSDLKLGGHVLNVSSVKPVRCELMKLMNVDVHLLEKSTKDTTGLHVSELDIQSVER